MKQVLGLIGSSRRLGNCELMVKAVFRHLDQPCELHLLRLTDFRIEPCRGCYRCLFKDGACVIRDDHQAVVDALTAADAVILAAPAYFLGAHSCLKRFLDRGLTFYGSVDRLWGKPAVGVAVAGIPGMEGHTLLGIDSFLKLILADVRQTQVVYGALPGEVFLTDGNTAIAQSLAGSLFGPRAPKAGPSCPLCGGDTFRFLGRDQVRCMLCSNTGTIRADGNGFAMAIRPADHQLFLTRDDVTTHREWLIGMKDRFKTMRGDLKPITLDYRKAGQWIKPPGMATELDSKKEPEP
jgi:multimeric flavodoxin WrbA